MIAGLDLGRFPRSPVGLLHAQPTVLNRRRTAQYARPPDRVIRRVMCSAPSRYRPGPAVWIRTPTSADHRSVPRDQGLHGDPDRGVGSVAEPQTRPAAVQLDRPGEIAANQVSEKRNDPQQVRLATGVGTDQHADRPQRADANILQTPEVLRAEFQQADRHRPSRPCSFGVRKPGSGRHWREPRQPPAKADAWGLLTLAWGGRRDVQRPRSRRPGSPRERA